MCTVVIATTHVRFGSRVGQFGPKWYKSGTDQISPPCAKLYWNLTWKSPRFVRFGANLTHFWPKSVTPVWENNCLLDQEMSIYNLSIALYPSECPEKPVIDLPMHLVFLCLPTDNILKVITAILCEERIVFVSENLALLTTVMEVKLLVHLIL